MEILAPCGSPGHIKAAVYAGADAVYMGGHAFSARRNAANFNAEQLREAVCFCRGFGVKAYIAVNILTRDGEWEQMRSYLRELFEIAPDALIVQDVGVAALCREMMPQMPLHASTQMSVHSVSGVRFCEEMGFSRVVIARECDRETLSQIIQSTGVGIEVFIHGALCVSVSGQCGLSAMLGGRSGNRGLCAQPCRLDFAAGERRFALSLKDLCLVEEAPLLREMGVCSVKIEGRMKRPEYVAAAVTAVRESLEGKSPRLEELRAVFSRGGFTKGYFLGSHDDMGGVRSEEDKRATAEALPRFAELMRAPSKRVPVSAELTVKAGQSCRLTLTCEEDAVTVFGDVPQSAVTRQTTEEEAVKQLSRMGSTPFSASGVTTHIEPGLTLSAAQLNALRRDACAKLLECRIKRLTPAYSLHPAVSDISAARVKTEPFLRVHCRTYKQALAALEGGAQVAVPADTAEYMADAFCDRLLVSPPRYVCDEKALTERLKTLYNKGARHLLCGNAAHAVVGRELGYALHGGLGLNVFNSKTAEFWARYGFCGLTASMELRLNEALALNSSIPVGLAAYGRLPLMLLRRCPTGRACVSGGQCELSDRTGRRFTLDCRDGVREMLNADVLWMADRLRELSGAGFLSLFLFDETPERAAEILRAYREGGAPPQGHTRGLLTRGVE